MSSRLVLAITGASGAIYGVRLLWLLRAAGCEVHLSISASGRTVIKQELGLDIDLGRFDADTLVLPPSFRLEHPSTLDIQRSVDVQPEKKLKAPSIARPTPKIEQPTGEVRYHHFEDLLAPIASGSFLTDGMVICPCSGGTLAAIAHGTSENLICRAADVHLKERRKLVLVPRETPLSVIQLDNMKRCAEAGAVILPAMPGFYHGARQISDLVDFIVARVCDQVGVPHDLMRRWGEADQQNPKSEARNPKQAPSTKDHVR
jgi:4-hydroxy-3-polyprenylbenzoate decarboxylase